MSIYLFNTLTKQKEEFKPIKNGKVGMYHCGPTVYNYAHIGNLRAYIFADIVRRTFEYNNYKVKQVINITDVGHLTSDSDEGEDKIEAGAQREGKTAKEITDFYADAFFKDLKKLNIKTKNTKFPKATDHIKDQIKLIQKLEKKGFTYQTSDGIYFNTAKDPNYGKLGIIDVTGLKEGARVEKNPEKKNPTDFALWKFSPKNSKRQQEWKSPWGIGFPGWHLECSAMSMKYLGENFDIHTGGIDHIPIHHNAEIAQSENATEKPFANYWLHFEHILIGKEKMAKSGNNFLTLEKLIKEKYSPLAYRYLILSAHYQNRLEFSWEALESANSALEQILEFALEQRQFGKINQKYQEKFNKLINDNLAIPQALALTWELLKDNSVSDNDKKATLLDFDKVLGFGLADLKPIKIPNEINKLVKEREIARVEKNWQKSDELREEIKKTGYEIKDTKTKTIVKKLK